MGYQDPAKDALDGGQEGRVLALFREFDDVKQEQQSDHHAKESALHDRRIP